MRYETIRDRINAGEFEYKLPYPTDELLKKHEGYQKLTKEILQFHAEIANLTSQRGILLSDMKRAWRNGENDLVVEFRAAVEKEYGLQDHPNRDKIWRKAWDDGHSGGLSEVLNVYDELAELIL